MILVIPSGLGTRELNALSGLLAAGAVRPLVMALLQSFHLLQAKACQTLVLVIVRRGSKGLWVLPCLIGGAVASLTYLISLHLRTGNETSLLVLALPQVLALRGIIV